MLPQLSVGHPFNPWATVPLIPPAALALNTLCGLVISRLIAGKRVKTGFFSSPLRISDLVKRWVFGAEVTKSDEAWTKALADDNDKSGLSKKKGGLKSLLARNWDRVTLCARGAGALAVVLMFKWATSFGPGKDLEAAGSGTFFTPVGGLATTGAYAHSRNPMYASLIFTGIPATCLVTDTLWPLVGPPGVVFMYLYLRFVVIAAEENLLRGAFGAEFEAYCNAVPRWNWWFPF